MKKFYGSIPAIITPFLKNFEIDFDKLAKHINFLIDAGSHGIVSCGTTGESPTLSHEEHKTVTEFIIKIVNKRVPVMAGCGSNSTFETVDLVRHAYAAKADAVLLVSPYYNKPTQIGLFNHFKTVSEKCPNIGIYLYNIPGRSIVNIEVETIRRLLKYKNILGVKDATGDLNLPMELIQACGKKFIQISGEDSTFLAHLVSGGAGCISVTANVVPNLVSKIFMLWKEKKISEAMRLNQRLFNLNKALFLETSPAPVKYALSKLEKCENVLRLPMVPIGKTTQNKVDEALIGLGLSIK